MSWPQRCHGHSGVMTSGVFVASGVTVAGCSTWSSRRHHGRAALLLLAITEATGFPQSSVIRV